MHTGSLTLLPPHIHFSFHFSSLKVTSTLSYSLLRQCLKNDEPCSATPTPTMWLNKDPLLFLPGILNISPPSLGSLQRISSTQERFLSRWRDFLTASEMVAPRAKPLWKHETAENPTDFDCEHQVWKKYVAQFFSCCYIVLTWAYRHVPLVWDAEKSICDFWLRYWSR